MEQQTSPEPGGPHKTRPEIMVSHTIFYQDCQAVCSRPHLVPSSSSCQYSQTQDLGYQSSASQCQHIQWEVPLLLCFQAFKMVSSQNCCCDNTPCKISWKKQFGGKAIGLASNSRLYYFTVGQCQWQVLETTGHITSTVMRADVLSLNDYA